jgi:hypothetical protein
MVLQEGDGPLHRLIPERLRATREAGGQGGDEFLRPKRGVVTPAAIRERAGVPALLIALDPVMDADAGGPQQSGNLGDGSADACFQDGQGTPEQADLLGGTQLLFESALLGSGQMQLAHGEPRLQLSKGITSHDECKVSTCDPLRYAGI